MNVDLYGDDDGDVIERKLSEKVGKGSRRNSLMENEQVYESMDDDD